jgi:hypothetical protein
MGPQDVEESWCIEEGAVGVVESVVHEEESRQLTGLLKKSGEPGALSLAE